MNILDVLVKKGIIEERELPELQKEIAAVGGDIEAALLKRGINTQDILATKGELFSVPPRSLEGVNVPFDILKYVPEESAAYYHFVPIGLKDRVLEVGIVDPDNIEARDALNFISSKINMPFKLFLITQEDFERVLQMYHGLTGQLSEALSEFDIELSTEKKAADEGRPDEQLLEMAAATGNTKIIEDAPVTKMAHTILYYAVEGGASDIHIEPMENSVRVRYRVDGSLNTTFEFPSKVLSALVAQIKIRANLRLDEKRKPQDGRFSAKIDGKRIDFRVSTFPSYYGEKVVMRILDRDKGGKKLDDIGLTDRNLQLIRKAIQKPYGLILISGPTGSGKSTTLFSMLQEVDRDTRNVLSLEDPVEYNVPGVSQSQVRAEIGYTFANGLRTVLRQDPDVIMVGEIRDKETAQLAVQAALTGHLVLSTIHTNNAAGVIPRLIDFGVDPFLIGPTLICAIAQRLVRKITPGNAKKVKLDEGMRLMVEKELEELPAEVRKKLPSLEYVHEAQPSSDNPSGTRGRVAVMEVLEMSNELQKLVLTNPAAIEIMKIARKQGMLTLQEDGIIKSAQGIVPFDDVRKELYGAVFNADEGLEEIKEHDPVATEETTEEIKEEVKSV